MRKLPEHGHATSDTENLFGQNQEFSQNQSQNIGKAQPHESAALHVTGKARYVDDIPTPMGCLHAYVGGAPIATGKLIGLDLTQVKQSQGIVDVITVADIPGSKDIGPVFAGDPLLVDKHISYFAQPGFSVLAETREQARQAAKLAQWQVKEASPILNLSQAQTHNKQVRPSHTLHKGQVEQAIPTAPRHLHVQQRVGGQEHFYLEGQVALAVPQEDGGVLVYSSTQHPSEIQKLVAEVLNIPMHLVVVDMRRMGGGFGGKETQAAQWACLAALLAVRNQVAVKMRLARSDDMQWTGKRHGFINEADVGFDEQGRIIAVQANLHGLCGASPDLSDAIVDRAMFHADNAYYYPHADITGHRWFQNTVSHTAFRGFGGPQGMMLAEQIMDDVARNIGQDPLSVRLRNLYSTQRGLLTPYHQQVEGTDFAAIIESLADTSAYWQRRQAITDFNQNAQQNHQSFVRGLALTPVKFGISFTAQFLNQAGALVHIYTDGSIQVNHGGTEMGQGLHTKIRQIAAAELGVPLTTITVTSTRTDKVPNTSPTAASSGTDLNGQATAKACQILKQRLQDMVAEQAKCAVEQVTFNAGKVSWPEAEASFVEIVQQAYLARVSLSATGYYRTPKIYYDRDKAMGQPFYYFTCGAAVSEVEINKLTGMYHVRRVDILHDAGYSLNPAVDIGQIEGGFIQGMGWLTSEELVWDEQGKLATNSGATYKIPAIGDTPAEFNVALVANSKNHAATIFHSKAVGEPPLMYAISVWSALRDAIYQAHNSQLNPPLDTPATPERVFWALQASQPKVNQLPAKQVPQE